MEASPSSRLRRRSRRRLSRPPCSEPGRLPLRVVPLPMRLRLRVGPTKAVSDGSLPDISTASTSMTRSRTLFTGIGISTPYSRSSSSSFPVLPALIGCLAIWRTRRFHTRGRGLAIAAVVINVLTTIIVIWMTMHGISMDDMYQAMLNMLAPGMGGSGSGDSVSV